MTVNLPISPLNDQAINKHINQLLSSHLCFNQSFKQSTKHFNHLYFKISNIHSISQLSQSFNHLCINISINSYFSMSIMNSIIYQQISQSINQQTTIPFQSNNNCFQETLQVLDFHRES